MQKKSENEAAGEILFGILDGSASAQERDWFEKWLQQDADNGNLFNEYKLIYHWFKEGPGAVTGNKEKSWDRIKTSYYKSRFIEADREIKLGRQVFIKIISAAAAVIFIFLAGFTAVSLLRGSGPKGKNYNEIYVPLGARSQIALSDGTVVWLNAGSTLRYPADFNRKSREVMLEGEAYFDVASNRNKIFIVQTRDLNIKVFGTQFNVRSYPEENVVHTTLVEGSLLVEPLKGNSKKNSVMLKPNQSARFYRTAEPQDIEPEVAAEPVTSKTEQLEIIHVPDPAPITSWKDSKWVIIGERLDDLAVQLERRYNVRIVFADESLKTYKFSGTLKEETFEQVLSILQLSMPILYTVNENNVVLREDKSFKQKYDLMIKSPESKN